MNTTRLIAILAVLVMTLAGCASLSSVSADVSSFGQWPADRVKPRFVFERLPSQQAQADLQNRIEAGALPELVAKGFVKVDTPEQADVLVQVAVQSRSVGGGLYNDPYYRPYDGRFFGGGLGFGGLWGGRGGIGIGISMEPSRSQMQVDVLVRDRRSSQTLYETHAVHQRAGTVVESLMPVLFRAALMDFPAQGISPRRVTVDVPFPGTAAASAPAPGASVPVVAPAN